MQTAPVIAAASDMSPKPKIDLLVDAGLVDLASTLSGVNRVLSANRAEWLAAIENPDLSWTDCALKIDELVREIKARRYDKVVNLTHTPVSGCLASLATRTGEVSGIAGVRDGFLLAGDWERYFNSIQKFRDLGAFNLVDINLRIAGAPQPSRNTTLQLEPSLVEYYRNLMKKGTTGENHPLIALQLGANSPLRRLPVGMFSRTAELLAEGLNARFVLVGAQAEGEYVREFVASCKAVHTDLTGHTSLVELAAALSCCNLLISGDTGTLHLAAALGIPTVSIFLGMARPHDTAPYGEGHVVFEPVRDCYPCAEDYRCFHPDCHRDISPEVVADAAFELIRGLAPGIHDGASYRLRRTCFDEDGFLSLQGETKTVPDRRRALMRRMWKSELMGVTTDNQSGAQDIISADELSGLRELEQLSLDGVTLCQTIKRKISVEQPVTDDIQSLKAIAGEIDQHASGSGVPAQLSYIHNLEMATVHLNGSNPTALQRLYMILFRRADFILAAAVSPEEKSRRLQVSSIPVQEILL